MINCVIVDDEPLALDLLQDYIEQVSSLHLVARCTSAAQAEVVLRDNEVHLMFLDIKMPDKNGISFLQSLRLHQRPLVVFTTAYNEYALQGFDLDVLDYLMKPVSFERFLKSVHKAQSQLLQNQTTSNEPRVKKDYVFVKSDYKTFKVDTDDIIYIEGLKDYSKFCTNNGNILTLKSLKAIESLLPKSDFVRVHRSYIIAVKKIKVISRSQITLSNDVSIPLSEGFKEELHSIINQNQI